MDKTNNAALIKLAAVWRWDGDWMVCRGCSAVLIASRDGEPLRHKSGDCKHGAHVHPWTDLRNALSN